MKKYILILITIIVLLFVILGLEISTDMKNKILIFAIIGTVVIIYIIFLVLILKNKINFNNKKKPKTSNKETKQVNSNKSPQKNTVQNKYSRTKIIDLLERGTKYKNYFCEYYSKQRIIRKIKDDKMVIQLENLKTTVYIDYRENEVTLIKDETGVAIYGNLKSTKIPKFDRIYYQWCLDMVQNKKYKYSYVNTEEVDGFNCIKVNLKSKEKDYSVDIYIDSETGLVKKCFVKNGSKHQDINYNLIIDIVENEEVKTPDLSVYRIAEMDQ